MEKSSTVYVGMDVHKESIDVTLAETGGEVRRFGTIGGDRGAVQRLLRQLGRTQRRLHVVYEAGPCGWWLQRLCVGLGHACSVVAPLLTPRRAGERIKTDRRDSEKLARLARAGELQALYVPDAGDEAIRDLVRSREDAVVAQRRARQQLKALLLRHEIRYVGRTSWTGAHRRWLAELKLPEPAQQIAFEEYVMAIQTHIGAWRFAPVVAGLQALRGVQFIHAVTLICELGDLSRFDTPRQLMGYPMHYRMQDLARPA